MKRPVAVAVAAAVLMSLATIEQADAADGPAASAAVLACAKKSLSASDLKAIQRGDMESLTAPGLAAAYTCNSTGGRTSFVKIDPKARIVTASPFDPAVVTRLSRFRSCAGHDYSGLNISGQRENQRSMKTYVDTSIPVTSAHALTAVAPFAGTATISDTENGYGKQMTITSPKGWVFTYFHGDPTIRNGAKVKAGQPVIQFPPAQPNSQADQLTATFDMSLMTVDGRRDNVFSHLSPSVASTWAARGFTSESTAFTMSERDAAPCVNFQTTGSAFVQAN